MSPEHAEQRLGIFRYLSESSLEEESKYAIIMLIEGSNYILIFSTVGVKHLEPLCVISI